MPVINVLAGVTTRPHFAAAGCIITVTPDVGATAKVEYTKASAPDIANGVAVWSTWPKGTVSSTASDLVDQAAHIRVTAAGGKVAFLLNTSPTAAELASFIAQDWGQVGGVQIAADASGSVTGLAGPDGSVLYGSLASGAWMKVPTVFRLRLTGTGTCVIDSRNRLGVVSTAIASFSPSGATNQIEYPYPGDDAVEIRATLTGTCKAEVI